jgi:hypothetical protein
MDKSEVQSIAERELKRLSKRLGLTHWEIKLSFLPEATDDDGLLRRGECTRLVDYYNAHISLNPEAFDDEESLVKTLRHELFHIVLAPFDLYTSLVADAVEEDKIAREMLDRVRDHACEQTVVNLEIMFNCIILQD